MYHGTNTFFLEFDCDRSDMGAHFGTRAQARRRGSLCILPCFLSMKRPFRAKQDIGRWNYMEPWVEYLEDCELDGGALRLTPRQIDGLKKRGEGRQDTFGRDIMMPLLRRRGYDGVTYINMHEGTHAGHAGRAWMAFYAWQIKSATGNSGEFSRRNDNFYDDLYL